MKTAFVNTFIAILLFSPGLLLSESKGLIWKPSKVPQKIEYSPTSLPSHRLYNDYFTGVHNAGALYTHFSSNGISSWPSWPEELLDPETEELLHYTEYPSDSGLYYVFLGALWIGGIVEDDTLVSVGHTGWFTTDEEFGPSYSEGGTHRTSGYADDEFVAFFTDDISGAINPLDIRVKRNSYSWADTLYDDFVLMKYTVYNTGSNFITDGWIGYYMDGDAYHVSIENQGYIDDITGKLEVQLHPGDPMSQTLIPYVIDNDGDPIGSTWGTASVRSAISMRIVDSDFDIEHVNYNWYMSNGNPEYDYGPRQIEEPFRVFSDSNLGTPVSEEDRYFLMSHPEVDYDQIESAIIDSSDGWVPPSSPARAEDYADGYDTRFVLSFGPFDLGPSDSISFWLTQAAGPLVHVSPDDFSNYFNAQNPGIFQSTLDFSELLLVHRRIDSVYWSELMLPNPGAPANLQLVVYSAGIAELIWDSCNRPDLSGYNIYYKDTIIDNDWHQINVNLISNNYYSFQVPDPSHYYQIAISLEDLQGRESALSVPILTGPLPVSGLTCSSYLMDVHLWWNFHPDSTLDKYRIYRLVTEYPDWSGNFELYDSALGYGRYYVDYNTESGLIHQYKLTAVNDDGLESSLSESVYAIPMTKDAGLLFYNMNTNSGPNSIAYSETYVNELYDSLADLLPISRIDFDDSLLSMKTISKYSAVVFMGGSRLAYLDEEDSGVRFMLHSFLKNGGEIVVSVTNMADIPLNAYGEPEVTHYDYASNESYYWGMDSCVTNHIVFDGAVIGDLMSCHSLNPQLYPDLTVDTNKLAESAIPILGFMPFSGYVFPNHSVEPIYTYVSSVVDTINQGQINAYRYQSAAHNLVIFNFPLTIMESPANFHALRQALIDIGIKEAYLCSDANRDNVVNVGDVVYIINYIFRDGPAPDPLCIANANGEPPPLVNIGDAVYLVNYIWRDGPPPVLGCCQ